MPGFEEIARCDAPAEEVWKLLHDPARFPDWWAGVEKVERMGDTVTRYMEAWPDFAYPTQVSARRDEAQVTVSCCSRTSATTGRSRRRRTAVSSRCAWRSQRPTRRGWKRCAKRCGPPSRASWPWPSGMRAVRRGIDARATGTVDRGRHQLRVGSPLTLEDSEPEPDLAVIPHDAPRPYHPATAALVIEVSASSLQRDLARKPSLYAAAGIDEYWVIDLDGRRVVTHRDTRSYGYAEVVEVHAGGELAPAGLEIGAVGLDDLLRAAAA